MPKFELGTPVNTALFFFILYSVQRIIYPKVYTPAEGAEVPNEFKKGMGFFRCSRFHFHFHSRSFLFRSAAFRARTS